MSNAIEAIKNAPLRQVKSVKDLLWNEQAKGQLAAVAAKHMNPERMMRVVANAIRTTPKLQECEPMSFLGALMQCAALGLEPNSALGHAYLIPFENKRNGVIEVQMVIGYKGFIDLARRSGQLAAIHGDVIYDDDKVFSHEYGSNQHLRHVPGPRRGKMIGAYCYVKLKVGDMVAEGHRVLSTEEIIRHRDTHSQGWKTAVRFGKTKDSPWNPENPSFEAMCIKTAIRAMANRGELPMSIEFMDAIEADEAKADYRAFAMDPTQGLTIDAEAEDPTGEADADEGPAMVEHARTVDAAPMKQPEPERVAEPARTEAQRETRKRAPAADPKPAPDPVQKDPEPEAAAPTEQQGLALSGSAPGSPAAKTVEQRFEESAFVRMVLNDLGDMGRDATLDMHGDEITAMKRRDPDLVARLMQEIDRY